MIKIIVGIIIIAVLGYFAWVLCSLTSKIDKYEGYARTALKKPRIIEKLKVRGTYTRNQKKIVRKLNELIEEHNGSEK